MAVMTVPLADRSHAAITQLALTEPGMLLEDGRILPFLSRLTTLTSGGRCAWELVFTSVAAPGGVTLQARLITHTAVPAAQRHTLPELAGRTLEKLLAALQDNGIAAQDISGPLPPLRERAVTALCKAGSPLVSDEAMLSPGQLRQRLCRQPGNGFSLLLVQSSWRESEQSLYTAGMTPARQAMLAKDPVFDFAVTLWGPDAADNAAWLQGLTLNALAPADPGSPAVYAGCLRHDPWRLMTLLSTPAAEPRKTLLTLSELLTVCGCPAEPGEMQRMCRTGWREQAMQALEEASITPQADDMTLQPDDLRYMGLEADSDLEKVLHVDPALCDMLRMCVAILRRLGVMQPGVSITQSAPQDRDASLTGLLLPSVGHIYEQFVRECCYRTMYVPYYTYATGRRPAPVSKVMLSAYDIGPDPRGYRIRALPAAASDSELHSFIHEQMIDDFTAFAAVEGRKLPDSWWYSLFSDMYAARLQRNGLTHERADLRSAETFARSFLLERPGSPSLLRRLLMCRSIASNFPG